MMTAQETKYVLYLTRKLFFPFLLKIASSLGVIGSNFEVLKSFQAIMNRHCPFSCYLTPDKFVQTEASVLGLFFFIKAMQQQKDL